MGKKTFWVSLITLILLLILFEWTNIDLSLQEQFYLPLEKTWILKDPGLKLRAIFYNNIKIPIYFIGATALITSLISWKKNIWISHRKGLYIVTLSLIILPSLIAGIGKNISNVHCPDDLSHFAGKIPYVKLFDSYPVNPNSPDGKWPRGRCFPAGHASGGFALISLYCLFKSPRYKWAALFFALALGWTMGIYQMLRGAHFLSHTLTTMMMAFILVSTLNILIKDFDYESTKA